MSKQKVKATLDKKRSERRITTKLAPWIAEIASSYRIGDTTVSENSIPILKVALRTSYNEAAYDVLRFDPREFKQNEMSVFEEVARSIARVLTRAFDVKSDFSTSEVTDTANNIVKRTTQLAIENQYTQLEAKNVLVNYLKSQRSRTAMTESQWAVETTRYVAVKEIQEPLDAATEEVIRFSENGELDKAVEKSEEVAELEEMPSSESQRDIIQSLDKSNDALLIFLATASTTGKLRGLLARSRQRAKEWQTLGDSDVRDTHEDVNGQQRGLDEPFNLPGGILQYPGDGSLGADLGEIINCRCATVYL